MIKEAIPTDEYLEIQTYHAEMVPAILCLLQQTLGNNGAVRKSEAFWHWKHHRSPFGQSHGLYMWSEAKQIIAGLRVLMRWQFEAPDGQQIHAARAVDTATHPAYQRQGLFSTLTRQAIDELAQEGVDLIFNTPNRHSLPGYLKMGWQVVTDWPVYVKLLRPFRMLLRRVPALPRSTPPSHQWDADFAPQILPWPQFAQRYAEPATALVTAWEQRRHQAGLRTPREWAYLEWRYGQHPNVNYGVYPFFEVDNANKLAGFAILRPNRRYGWQEIVLAELFLARPDLQLGKRLIRTLSRQLRGDYLVAHFAVDSLERLILRSSNFLPVPRQGITFATRPLQPARQNLVHPSAWDLTLGDLEIF